VAGSRRFYRVRRAGPQVSPVPAARAGRDRRRPWWRRGRLGLAKGLAKEDYALPILEDHKMSVAEARTEVEAEGFTFDRLIRALPRQHILVFRKPKA
jgi:hypothetical protein